ncbi:unnamed protein product [Rhizophagus irregularis]|nr:unnamed protein product [Rhizophagus irregularis]
MSLLHYYKPVNTNANNNRNKNKQMKRTTSIEEEIDKLDEANPHRSSTSFSQKRKNIKISYIKNLHTSSIRKAKITRMVLTPPLTLDQLVRLLEKDQLEPDDDDDKRTIGNMYGFIPTLMEYPKREARLHLKEPEDNKLLPHLKTINVVVKKLNQTEFPSQPIFLQKMLNDLRRLNLLNYIKKNLEVNIREFDGNELTLNPPIQPGDL